METLESFERGMEFQGLTPDSVTRINDFIIVAFFRLVDVDVAYGKSFFFNDNFLDNSWQIPGS